MEERDQKQEAEGGEKSFAELFNESEPDRGWLKPGQRVEAVVVKITPEWVFIDVGGKHEGYLDRREFLDAEGNLTIAEGQTIRSYFLSSQRNEKLFTTKVGAGEAGRAFLEDASRSGIPVEGVVEREVKGGFEVKVAGDIRGFCPFSQMGLFRVETPADWVGKRLAFRIIEYGERGRNIVVSHRAILEEEQAKQREVLKASLKEGQTVKGTVVSLQKFGAFVDLGGIQALIPISEIVWEHVADISEQAQPRPGGGGGHPETGLGEGPDLVEPPLETARSLGAHRDRISRGFVLHRHGGPSDEIRRLRHPDPRG